MTPFSLTVEISWFRDKMVKNLEARRPTLRQTDEEVKVFFSEVTCVVFYCSAEVLTIAE
jgi:hypothetical protein